MFVGRQGVGSRASTDDYNRAYGLDLGWQATSNGALYALSWRRTDSPGEQGRLRLRRRHLVYATRTTCGPGAPATRRSATDSIPRSASCGGGATGSVEGQLQPPLPAEAVAVLDPAFRAARELHRLPGSPEPPRELTRPLALLRHPDAVRRTLRVPHRSPARTVHGSPSRSIRTSRDVASSCRRASTGGCGGSFEGNTNLSAPIQRVAVPSRRQLLRRRLPRVAT